MNPEELGKCDRVSVTDEAMPDPSRHTLLEQSCDRLPKLVALQSAPATCLLRELRALMELALEFVLDRMSEDFHQFQNERKQWRQMRCANCGSTELENYGDARDTANDPD